MDSIKELPDVWERLQKHGRAGVGRPRKDSQAVTLAQLGFSKWDARQMFTLAEITPEQLEQVVVKTLSVTAIIENKSARARAKNPLIRAWRIATVDERVKFLRVLDRLRFFAEREDALKG